MVTLLSIADIQAGYNVLPAKEDRGVFVLTMASLPGVHALGCDASFLYHAQADPKLSDTKYRVQALDILLPVRTTPSHLNPVILPFGFQENHAIGATLLRIRVDHAQVDPWWLLGYLRSPIGMKQLLEGSQSNTAQLNLNTKAVSQLTISLPSREKQAQIGEYLALAEQAKQSAIKAAELRFNIAQTIAFQNQQDA